MRDVDRLTACLAELDQSGWKLTDYLVSHPGVEDTLHLSLVAASRMRALPTPIPSEAFRARSRAQLTTFIQNEALRRPSRTGPLHLRRVGAALIRSIFVPLAAAVLVLGGSAGIWSVSATALPGSPLYGAKLGIERLHQITAFTPEQQVSVHLSLASARLQEANAETWAGNQTQSQALLRDYDREVATAQAILLSITNVPGSDSLLAQSDWELVLLQEDRQRLVESGMPLTPPGDTASMTSSSAESTSLVITQPTVSPEDPSKMQEAAVVSAENTTRGSSSSVSATSDRSAIGLSGVVGVAVNVSQPDQSTSSVTVIEGADRIDRLVRILLAQASAGDSAGATLSAQQFALDVKSGHANGTLSTSRLLFDRTRLQAALMVAPGSTRSSLALALEAIYQAIPGSRPALPAPVVTRAPSAPSEAPAASGGSTRDIPPTTSPVIQPAPGNQPDPKEQMKSPGSQTPGPNGQRSPVPVVHPPARSNPILPRPIIVRDPDHLPIAALRGRRPLIIATAPGALSDGNPSARSSPILPRPIIVLGLDHLPIAALGGQRPLIIATAPGAVSNGNPSALPPLSPPTPVSNPYPIDMGKGDGAQPTSPAAASPVGPVISPPNVSLPIQPAPFFVR